MECFYPLNENLANKANANHTHNYAGSASAGGSATSAVKLDSSAGSTTQPVYFNSGKPVARTHSLEKSVPANAVFTDTVPLYKTGKGTRNTTNTTNGEVRYHQYGRVVIVTGMIYLSAAANETWHDYTIVSGLPGCVEEELYISPISVDDDYASGFFRVSKSGNLIVVTRHKSLQSKAIYISGTYMTN